MESKIPRVPVTTIVECRRRPVSNAEDDQCRMPETTIVTVVSTPPAPASVAPPTEQPVGDSYGSMPRHIIVLGSNPTYCNNNSTSAKYTPKTFLPLTLSEVLDPRYKCTNIYFVVAGALQFIPSITLTGGVSTIWINVGILMVMDITMMGLQDYARARADTLTNKLPVERCGADTLATKGVHQPTGSGGTGSAAAFRSATWADVKVGDIVRVKDREAFPADCVFLRACDPEPGQCWVSTKPLDGESDTKLRLAVKQAAALMPDAEPATCLKALRGATFRAEPPNDKVNDFTGLLFLEGQEPVLVTPQNMLLRGTQLRSTSWVYALVVATGRDTKANFATSSAAVVKFPTTLRRLNVDIAVLFCVTISISLIGAIANLAWGAGRPSQTEQWYLFEAPSTALFPSFGMNFLQTFLLVYMFIPTTLFSTMPLIQIFSSLFMISDLDMYDEAQDECCLVNSPSLTEELGQVTHIFSDKTGTLTSNHMEFMRCFIDGVTYGCGDTAISQVLNKQPGRPPPALRTAPRPAWATVRPCSATFVNFQEALSSPSLFDALHGSRACAYKEFFLALAINHSVMVEEVNGKQDLAASSPDEQAFVAGAELFGFEYLSRNTFEGRLTLRDKHDGVTYDVQILDVFPYESSRKRMSMLVRLPEGLVRALGGGEAIRLYCKGADSKLMELVEETTPEEVQEELSTLLDEWGEIALRTLVWGKKEISEATYAAWHAQYEAVCASPDEIAKMKKGLPNKITSSQSELESTLILQGSTAIEDKLQQGVPELLADLRTAGIKIWMLTGDKVGTAVNIARACEILPGSAKVLEITSDEYPVLAAVRTEDLLECQRELLQLDKANEALTAPSCVTRWRAWCARSFMLPSQQRKQAEARAAARREVIGRHTAALDAKYEGLLELRTELREHIDDVLSGVAEAAAAKKAPLEYCLVIDEKAIEYCGTLMPEALAAVGDASKSVVACRARKDQKAQMLNLIKNAVPGCCCLAIGDGANDVAMIKAGHIGVGIIGKEGRECVNSADFAIGQFQFLRSLLLVHGRLNYRRFAMFLYYTFYKNIFVTMTLFFYQTLAASSITLLLPSVFNDLLNPVMLTSLPIIIYPLFDNDVPKHVSAHSPLLYTQGIARLHFTHRGMLLWVLEGIYSAALVAYLPGLLISFGRDGDVVTGQLAGGISLSELSVGALWTLCVCINVRLILENNSWSVVEFLGPFLMIAMLAVWSVIFEYVPSRQYDGSFSWPLLYNVMGTVLLSGPFWLQMLLLIVLVIAPRMLHLAYIHIYYQSPLAAPDAKDAFSRMSSHEEISSADDADVEEGATPQDPTSASASPPKPSTLRRSTTTSKVDLGVDLGARHNYDQAVARKEIAMLSRASSARLSHADSHGWLVPRVGTDGTDGNSQRSLSERSPSGRSLGTSGAAPARGLSRRASIKAFNEPGRLSVRRSCSSPAEVASPTGISLSEINASSVASSPEELGRSPLVRQPTARRDNTSLMSRAQNTFDIDSVSQNVMLARLTTLGRHSFSTLLSEMDNEREEAAMLRGRARSDETQYALPSEPAPPRTPEQVQPRSTATPLSSVAVTADD